LVIIVKIANVNMKKYKDMNKDKDKNKYKDAQKMLEKCK